MEAAIIRESLSLTKQIRFDTEHNGVILVSQPPRALPHLSLGL